jgi:hypothetical protein
MTTGLTITAEKLPSCSSRSILYIPVQGLGLPIAASEASRSYPDLTSDVLANIPFYVISILSSATDIKQRRTAERRIIPPT